MASELERIAGRLRFLSDQAQQHRQPVLEASRKLREAASTVHTARFEQPEGTPVIAPPHLAARLTQAAERAGQTVAPLSQTAELLRMFAGRLTSGAAAGRPAVPGDRSGQPAPSSGDGPPPAPSSAPPSSDDRPAPTGPDRRAGSSSASGGTGSVGPSRYGRYPTTTAVRLSPGNRSYEVGR